MCGKTFFKHTRDVDTLSKEDLQVAMEPGRRCSVSQEETPLRSHVVPNRMAIAVTERKQSSMWLKDRPRWQECKMLTYRGTQYGGSTDN